MISPELCIKCKGKLFCGLQKCPILERQSRESKLSSLIVDRDFSGLTPPGFFVSWQNYPKVSVAPLSSLLIDNPELLDFPEKWFGLPQEKIIDFRENLLCSYKNMPVSLASNPSYELQDFQEIAMSSSIVDVNVKLEEKPRQSLSFDSFSAPLGPTAKLFKLSLESNPKIPKKVDAFYHDFDAKSSLALIDLFEHNYPVSSLSKILSSGAFGVKKNRRLVPTRWAITAVDSIISKYLIDEKIKSFSLIDSFQLFNSNYLDNNFWVMLLPYPWAFEVLESWLPGSVWTTQLNEVKIMQDYELNKGLKNYPEEVEGAYFAARLAVAEYLAKEKKQSACIVFREVGEKYAVPLGVWQVRENVRNALKQKPIVFSTASLAFDFLSKKLRVPFSRYKAKSILYSYFVKQKKITEWF